MCIVLIEYQPLEIHDMLFDLIHVPEDLRRTVMLHSISTRFHRTGIHEDKVWLKVSENGDEFVNAKRGRQSQARASALPCVRPIELVLDSMASYLAE
jgi:hypothetical protein